MIQMFLFYPFIKQKWIYHIIESPNKNGATLIKHSKIIYQPLLYENVTWLHLIIGWDKALL